MYKDQLAKLTKFLKEKYGISISKQDQIFFLIGVLQTETETFYCTRDEIYLTEQGIDFIEKNIKEQKKGMKSNVVIIDDFDIEE